MVDQMSEEAAFDRIEKAFACTKPNLIYLDWH